MKHGLLYRFVVRWLVCSLGLWIAAGLLSSHISFNTGGSVLWVALMSGFILAVVNAVIKPLLVLLSLPAILLTLGLFMLVINGFSVLLVSWLYKPLQVTNFWGAILAGLVIGVVNYLVSAILESRER
ncbi:MAG TPA: phage holin family protein [Candidatus Saccharimonadales bacterium]|nr:phage holin family protein [Candidatus Saccharimonadales bacterium]